MARGRMISKSLSTSQRFARVHEVAGRTAEFAQILYALLLAHADDFGRIEGDPFHIKHAIVPTSPRPVSSVGDALRTLAVVGLIDWYEVEGRKYIQINNFDDHQGGLHRRTASRFPAPSGKFPESIADSPRTEQNRTELNRNRTEPPDGDGESRGSLRDRFERFWAAYPRKVGKGAAWRAWQKIAPSETLTAVMVVAVGEQALTPQWRKDGGQFVPHPATWLHQGRWDDEPDVPSKAPTERGACASDVLHDPPCRTWHEHTQRVLAEARQARTGGAA